MRRPSPRANAAAVATLLLLRALGRRQTACCCSSAPSPHHTARGSTLDANMQDIAVDFYSNQHVLLIASQSRHGFRVSFFVRSRSGICLSNSGKQKATGNCSLSIDRRENMCFACTGEVARSYMNTGYWTRTSYSLCTTWYQLFCNR